MKATELRIGNWVQIVEAGKEYQVQQHNFCTDNDGYSAFLDHTQPIPLTEEWLMKFGFKSIGLQGQVFEHNKLIGGENRFVIETDCINFYPKINFDDCCWYKFTYVHQLQNLYFALTGNELEIK